MRVLKRKGVVLGAFAVLVVIATTPAYLRAFVVTGESDAPAYITGDRVLVSLAAYDLRVPYTSMRLASLADPRPGDVVLCRLRDNQLTIKRIVAGPGARISLHGGHLVIDGVALEYTDVLPQDEARIRRGNLGPLIQKERGNGPEVYISFDPAAVQGDDLREFTVPEGSYFVLGSNRDVSLDSRHFGGVPRERILGKVIGRI